MICNAICGEPWYEFVAAILLQLVLNSIAGSGKISSKDLPFGELSNEESFAMLVSNLGYYI